MPRFRSTNPDLQALPPEVLQQIDVAWERARELFESDLELHFEIDAACGRVWAELRRPDGIRGGAAFGDGGAGARVW